MGAEQESVPTTDQALEWQLQICVVRIPWNVLARTTWILVDCGRRREGLRRRLTRTRRRLRLVARGLFVAARHHGPVTVENRPNLGSDISRHPPCSVVQKLMLNSADGRRRRAGCSSTTARCAIGGSFQRRVQPCNGGQQLTRASGTCA